MMLWFIWKELGDIGCQMCYLPDHFNNKSCPQSKYISTIHRNIIVIKIYEES